MTAPAPKREILSIDDMPDNALVEEVATFFRTTKMIVRKWIRDGEFPHAYLEGRSYLIPKKDIIQRMNKMYGND